MAIDYEALMGGKAVEELDVYITEAEKYKPEAVWAAIHELKNRGKSFSKEELNTIETILVTKEKERIEDERSTGASSYNDFVVTDTNSPLLYSKRMIYTFSVIFNTVFGAVLLAINLKNKKQKIVVITFGVLYTMISGVVYQAYMSKKFGAFYLLNMLGGGLLALFWDKYIGKETKYRAKPYWKPLIISFIITIPIVVSFVLQRDSA